MPKISRKLRPAHQLPPLSAVVQIVRVNRYYSDKELEYFAPRSKGFGSIEILAKTVQHVAKRVFEPITEETFRGFSQEATCPLIVLLTE